MQAFLDHSVQNYGPLPSDLLPRRVRSRTHSRLWTYPSRSRRSFLASDQAISRSWKSSLSFDQAPSRSRKSSLTSDLAQVPAGELNESFGTAVHSVLLQISLDPNIARSGHVLKPDVKHEKAFGLPPNVRSRIDSGARRTTLAWTKRSTGKSSKEKKENVGQGTLTTSVFVDFIYFFLEFDVCMFDAQPE
jgi:serine/arginine repetitive matrix protein 2